LGLRNKKYWRTGAKTGGIKIREGATRKFIVAKLVKFMKMTLNMDSIKKIDLFHKISGADVLDCIEANNILFFIVKNGQYGLAVGKNGSKTRTAEHKFKKTIRIIEFSDKLDEFVKNLVPEAEKIDIDDDIKITVKPSDKAKIIGKNGSNIKAISSLVKRHFGIEVVKVR
jgi:N utilization substance protein A